MSLNSYIYFIQQGADGPIKIGISANPVDRFINLQGDNPDRLYMLGIIPEEGRGLEGELHQRFQDSRVRAEWFEPVPELIQFIKDHITPLDIEPKQVKGRIQRSNRKHIITKPFHDWDKNDWKCYLAEQGFTKDEVAARLGYSERYVVNLLNGSDPINDRARFRLMRAFPDCTEMLLASGNNNEPDPEPPLEPAS